MSDTTGATQAALISRYRSDTTLQGLMSGATSPEWSIFDQGGSGQIIPIFPYVYVHPITVAPGATFAFGNDAMAIDVGVSVFTQGQEGFSQARSIAARLYALTHGPLAGLLTLGSGTNVSVLFQNRQEIEEVTDTLIQHIADRYRVENQG